MKSLLLIALAATAWNGTVMAGSISIGTPLASGEVSGHTELSSQQLQVLSQWLEHHRSGWQGMITEAPIGEPVELTVSLTHSDGAVTCMVVIARPSGAHYVRLTGPGQWAYRSFGGILKSWAAIRALSDPELAQLQTAAGAGHRL